MEILGLHVTWHIADGRQTRPDQTGTTERGCGSIPARDVVVPGRKLLSARRRLVVTQIFTSWNQIHKWLRRVDSVRLFSRVSGRLAT